MKQVDPPAIVHEHVDLGAIAAEVNGLIVEAEDVTRKGAQLYRLIGERLLKVKAKVGHGQWQPWIEKNIVGRTCRQVRRYLRLAKTDVTSFLDEQWQVISGNARDDETEEGSRPTNGHAATPTTGLFGQPTEPWPAGYKPCRKHRINPSLWSPKCKDCKENNKPEEPEAVPASDDAPPAEASEAPKPKDGPDPTDYLSFWKRHGKTLASRLHQMRVALDIPRQDVNAAQQAFRVLQEFVKSHATAPIRQPEDGKCKRCGSRITWVTTAAHKRAPLDSEARGPVHVMPDGLAVQVTDSETGFKVKDGRQWHFVCCTSNEPIGD